MSTFLPMLTEIETQDTAPLTPTPQATPTPTTESTEMLPTRSNENDGVATENSQPEVASPMSVARIKSIRELLSQDGTSRRCQQRKTDLLKLLETDKEAANYLLERFSSSTEIEKWLSKQPTEVPPSKSNPQPLPPEVQP